MDAETEMQGASPSLSGRIRECYGDLSPTDKRLADLVLEFPGNVASYSATELARIAGVSNAAVSRFVQRLGFRNYEELRVLSREGRTSGSPLFLLEQAKDGADSDFVGAHVRSSTDNIVGTFQQIDPGVIDDIAGAIVEARHVWMLGWRNGYFLAGYLRWQFIQVRDGVRLLPSGGETLAEQLAGILPEDVVVVFGLRRRVRQLAGVVAAARRQGARIVYIADHGMAEDPGATWWLRCNTRSHAPLDNHTAVLALCHVLADRVFEKAGSAGRRRLACIEDVHDLLEEF
jgi:DNA-binding MurR/RpiR family transcriptional regulator